MPILLLLGGFFFPRIIILVLYFLTDWFATAFSSLLWLVLGFLFLPLTTLWYGISEAYFSESVQTIGIVIALLVDLGLIGGSTRSRRRSRA